MTANPLTIDQCFTPASAADWMKRELETASLLGLKTTAWQSGSVTRTILAVAAFMFELVDSSVSLIAQGGFLDFAATGSISYVGANGQTITQPVTPEGGPGWLDVLASSQYDVERIQATYAGGQIAILNTSVATYGPFPAGTYHVTDPFNNQGYSNVADLTVAPSTEVADIFAVASYFGAIQITTATPHGLTDDDIVAVADVVGVTTLPGTTAWAVTVQSSSEFILQGSVFAGAYASGGTVYTPTLATVTADTVGTVGNSDNDDGIADVNTVTQPVTALVGVTIANPVAYRGTDVESNRQLADRCRLQLQTRSPNGPRGAQEYFARTAGQFAATLGPPRKIGSANTRVTVATDAASGTVLVFLGNASGPASPEDVATTDAVLQAYACPNGVTVKAVAATEQEVRLRATIWLAPRHNTTANRVRFERALQSYFEALAIGGASDPQGSYTHVVPHEDVVGVIYETARDARIPLSNVNLTMNGSTDDLELFVNIGLEIAELAVLVPAVPIVRLVNV